MKNDCPICLEGMFDSQRSCVRMEQCGHFVHADCLDQYCKLNRYFDGSCVYCRCKPDSPSTIGGVPGRNGPNDDLSDDYDMSDEDVPEAGDLSDDDDDMSDDDDDMSDDDDDMSDDVDDMSDDDDDVVEEDETLQDDRIPDMMDGMSNGMSDGMSDDMSDDMSDGMSGGIEAEWSDGMSDGMSMVDRITREGMTEETAALMQIMDVSEMPFCGVGWDGMDLDKVDLSGSDLSGSDEGNGQASDSDGEDVLHQVAGSSPAARAGDVRLPLDSPSEVPYGGLLDLGMDELAQSAWLDQADDDCFSASNYDDAGSYDDGYSDYS
ncbi:RING finger protein [Gregarina niphandrodes]|uniref:RING finger protein n=1 Tax=Gregarina niphandrodes TaxID=110365 RepID=A0A023B5P0_GRENI|nr:RING finger protein [Gregarina niphandrodes]EZG60248.1 RING finger protein [Gregarina niphandrodes]|eukprot:XP_011130851.1 RING finger protein [Gregarina niphandrodes]